MPKTPQYRLRSGYTQAIVTLTDSLSGKRRDYWLGEFGTPASREAYHRLIAEWEAGDRRLPERDAARVEAAVGATIAHVRDGPEDWETGPLERVPANGADGGVAAAPPTAVRRLPAAGPSVVTVKEIVRAYWRWAKKYYRRNEAGTLKVALRLLRRYYGSMPAEKFGPKRLRLLREEMIRGDTSPTTFRKPWSRCYVNHQVRRIRQLFRWAASQEMVPATVAHALATIEPLKRGRTNAREGDPVMPVATSMIDAVRPYLNRQVTALMDLQLLTGARSGELMKMRAIDLDTSDKSGVWTFRPREHKTAHHGKARVVYLGPAAQRVLQPFLADRPVDAFLFSPAEADAERRAKLTASRKTKLGYGNGVGTNRKEAPARKPGDHYTTMSYYRALQRACDEALHPPAHLRPKTLPNGKLETKTAFTKRLTIEQKAELVTWRKAHRWHPHQLRHNAGTTIRKEFGLEAASLALGHSSANITDAVYAERDSSKVVEVMKRIG